MTYLIGQSHYGKILGNLTFLNSKIFVMALSLNEELAFEEMT
jgi:hypothetical protein